MRAYDLKSFQGCRPLKFDRKWVEAEFKAEILNNSEVKRPHRVLEK